MGLIAAQLGCAVVGLDRSAGALTHAMQHGAADVRFVQADARSLPFQPGSFQAVMVLDSLASIFEPTVLLEELRRVLAPGGRLGCTLEVGAPLGRAEVDQLATDIKACVLPLDGWLQLLGQAGFRQRRVQDATTTRAAVARRLVRGLVEERVALGHELGAEAVDGLTITLSAWADFLTRGRLRAVTLVAERSADDNVAGSIRAGRDTQLRRPTPAGIVAA
jgi:SAM-dependent methyltransferase